MILTVVTPIADILGNPQEPDKISNADSQLLYGEQFEVNESHGAYVKGRSLTDNYEGYVERDQLIKHAPESNAVIIAPSSHLYPEPNFKSRPLMPLSFFSRIALSDNEHNGFIQTNEGWVYSDHVQNLNELSLGMDLADTALLFYNTPYLFGGRSKFGIDCSALVQVAMMGCGYDCPPRDSKDQKNSIGKGVSKDNLLRNDIVFFEGHVGIMMDESNILNATARHMTTLIEPLEDLEKAYGDITAVRRL